MDHSRRRILALTSSLTLPVFAGCTGLTGGGSDSDDDGGDDGGGDDGGGDDGSEDRGDSTTATETETETETPTPTPEPPDEFLLRTRRVMDEIRWFATEYPRARRRYLVTVKPVQETIASLRQRNTLVQADVDELRTKTTALATYVRAELAPHFRIDRRLRNGDNYLVRNFATAVDRDDSRAIQDELARLSIFYNRVTTDSYVASNLSARPIAEPVHGLLQSTPDGKAIFGVSYPPGDNFMTQTFSDEYGSRSLPHAHRFSTGQRVYDHAHEHGPGHETRSHTNEPPDGRVYAFSEGAVDILKDTKLWRERLDDFETEFTNVFDAVTARDGREDYAYVMANELTTKPSSEAQFGGRPIFVQRYESEERAATALDTLMETTLRDDGTTTLAGRAWTKVYYDYDGANLYANVLQVGEFVIAASVSPTPHHRRSADEQWPEQIKLSWLGLEVAEDGSTESDG